MTAVISLPVAATVSSAHSEILEFTLSGLPQIRAGLVSQLAAPPPPTGATLAARPAFAGRIVPRCD
jgi:hypothetical protein